MMVLGRVAADEYFDLARRGIVSADDRVELLEGVIVAMSPQTPRHASAIRRIARVLRESLPEGFVISVQSPFLAGKRSVPEPDVAVLPGRDSDYDGAHPGAAVLVVEVAESSLVQDRITKARIYARAGVPEYWIVNLRDDVVEAYRSPDRATAVYSASETARRGGRLELIAVPAVAIEVAELLPRA